MKKIKIFDYLTLNNIKNIFSKNTEIYILKENYLSRLVNLFKLKKISKFKNNSPNLNFQNIEKFTSIFEDDSVGNFVYEYIEFTFKEKLQDNNFANYMVKHLCNSRNLISFMTIENFIYLNLILISSFKQNKVEIFLQDNIFKNFITFKYRYNHLNYFFYQSFNFSILKNYLSIIKKFIYILRFKKKILPKKICIMDSYPIHNPSEFFSDENFSDKTVFISNEKTNKDNIFYLYDFVNLESFKSLFINFVKNPPISCKTSSYFTKCILPLSICGL